MKVIKIILRVFLILLLVIILSTVGLGLFIYFSVKDSSNNTPQSVIDNNYSTTQVIHNQMVKSLNASSSDLELALDGEAINELVYAFMQ
jgi:anionic cell wall polymer biosynthesis LytR-Cps2A-Psr (LCP) family protein